MTDVLPLLRAYRAGDDPAIIARAADEIERLRAALYPFSRPPLSAHAPDALLHLMDFAGLPVVVAEFHAGVFQTASAALAEQEDPSHDR